VTALVAFVASWLAHTLSASRDRRNKRRDQRISFLIEAYRRLEFISNRPSLKDMDQFESAIADIQLFGSANQIRLAQAAAREFVDTKSVSLDPLLEAVRKDLRAELQLEYVSGKLIFLRYYPDAGKRKN
jgi:hypothetical protein